MGFLRIRQADKKRAMSTRHLNPELHTLKTSEAMLKHYLDEADKLGIAIVKKKKSKLRLSKMATTYYREIRVPHDFDDWEPHRRASLIAHEWVHVLQWRYYGRARFAWNYIRSARWRWAIEMQAYRESVAAYRVLGYSDKYIENYIDGKGPRMVKGYKLGAIRSRDLDKSTEAVLKLAA